MMKRCVLPSTPLSSSVRIKSDKPAPLPTSSHELALNVFEDQQAIHVRVSRGGINAASFVVLIAPIRHPVILIGTFF